MVLQAGKRAGPLMEKTPGLFHMARFCFYDSVYIAMSANRTSQQIEIC
jgi:hypothetical protein